MCTSLTARFSCHTRSITASSRGKQSKRCLPTQLFLRWPKCAWWECVCVVVAQHLCSVLWTLLGRVANHASFHAHARRATPTVVLSVHLFVSVSVSKAKSLGRNPRFVHPRERLFCLNIFDVGLQTKSVQRDPKRLFNKDKGLDIPENFLFPRGSAECKTWSGNVRYAHSSATSVHVAPLRIQKAPPCFRRCDASIWIYLFPIPSVVEKLFGTRCTWPLFPRFAFRLPQNRERKFLRWEFIRCRKVRLQHRKLWETRGNSVLGTPRCSGNCTLKRCP